MAQSYYRFFLVDAKRESTRAMWIAAASDEEALAVASVAADGRQKFELWLGTRCVFPPAASFAQAS